MTVALPATATVSAGTGTKTAPQYKRRKVRPEGRTFFIYRMPRMAREMESAILWRMMVRVSFGKMRS